MRAAQEKKPNPESCELGGMDWVRRSRKADLNLSAIRTDAINLLIDTRETILLRMEPSFCKTYRTYTESLHAMAF